MDGSLPKECVTDFWRASDLGNGIALVALEPSRALGAMLVPFQRTLDSWPRAGSLSHQRPTAFRIFQCALSPPPPRFRECAHTSATLLANVCRCSSVLLSTYCCQ